MSDQTDLRSLILEFVAGETTFGIFELEDRKKPEKIFIEEWTYRSYDKYQDALPCSSYNRRLSHMLGYPCIVIRKEFPGGWDDEALNKYDDQKDDLTDRETAAVITHEIGHYNPHFQNWDASCTPYQREVLAWTEAKQLWSDLDLRSVFGPFPRRYVADALSGYAEAERPDGDPVPA